MGGWGVGRVGGWGVGVPLVELKNTKNCYVFPPILIPLVEYENINMFLKILIPSVEFKNIAIEIPRFHTLIPYSRFLRVDETNLDGFFGTHFSQFTISQVRT